MVDLGLSLREVLALSLSWTDDVFPSSPMRKREEFYLRSSWYIMVPIVYPIHIFGKAHVPSVLPSSVNPPQCPTWAIQREEAHVKLAPNASHGSSIKSVRTSTLPKEGTAGPSLSFQPPSPLAVNAKWWHTYAVHPWVFTMVVRGYRLPFEMKPSSFSGVGFSEAPG